MFVVALVFSQEGIMNARITVATARYGFYTQVAEVRRDMQRLQQLLVRTARFTEDFLYKHRVGDNNKIQTAWWSIMRKGDPGDTLQQIFSLYGVIDQWKSNKWSVVRLTVLHNLHDGGVLELLTDVLEPLAVSPDGFPPRFLLHYWKPYLRESEFVHPIDADPALLLFRRPSGVLMPTDLPGFS